MGTIERVEKWLKSPWEIAHGAFKIIDGVYFVGTSWVSVYLLDTDEGLVLIDCAMQETLYQLIDNIRALGFDPHDIKHLLLSHGHFDHCGATRYIQEISDCKIWIAKEEEFFFTERRDLIAHEEDVPPFRIDSFYQKDGVIDFGNMQISTVHTPGHTPGTTSIFISASLNGKKVTLGMHGGLGSVMLSKQQLLDDNRPLETQQVYLDSLDQIENHVVDILIPSHVGHAKPYGYDFFALADKNTGNGEIFVDTGAWKRMIMGKRQEMLDLMNRE